VLTDDPQKVQCLCMTKYKVSAAALVLSAALGIIAPLSASALTVDELKTQIETLTSQLKALQQQLHSQVASTTEQWKTDHPFMASSTVPREVKCHVITRALALGSKGDDVTELQQELAQDSDIYPEGSVTGFFGPATAKAVQRFQEKYGIASTTAPVVGPRMREFLKLKCNLGNMPGVMGSTTLPMMPRFFGTSSTSTLPKPPFGEGRPMFNASGTPPMPPRGEGNRPYKFPLPGATSTQN
jgi:peptidoglycan hydrolase-like protein with peptidoglycan-binding domain